MGCGWHTKTLRHNLRAAILIIIDRPVHSPEHNAIKCCTLALPAVGCSMGKFMWHSIPKLLRSAMCLQWNSDAMIRFIGAMVRTGEIDPNSSVCGFNECGKAKRTKASSRKCRFEHHVWSTHCSQVQFDCRWDATIAGTERPTRANETVSQLPQIHIYLRKYRGKKCCRSIIITEQNMLKSPKQPRSSTNQNNANINNCECSAMRGKHLRTHTPKAYWSKNQATPSTKRAQSGMCCDAVLPLSGQHQQYNPTVSQRNIQKILFKVQLFVIYNGMNAYASIYYVRGRCLFLIPLIVYVRRCWCIKLVSKQHK